MSAVEVKGGRLSAWIYDPMVWLGERAGMAERRRRLLASARGRVLELGAGTGLNAARYPDGLERLVFTEPEPHMARRLARRVDRLGREAEVVEAPAETLPFEDGAFDTVVCTFVLCTVADPGRVADEVRRVLAPGGRLLFLEHVRSDGDERLARRQDRLHGAWASFADGCNCNRPTVELLRERGFDVAVGERGEWRRMPRIVRPLVAGSAAPA